MGLDLLAITVHFCKSTFLRIYFKEIENAIRPQPPEDPFIPHVKHRLKNMALQD